MAKHKDDLAPLSFIVPVVGIGVGIIIWGFIHHAMNRPATTPRRNGQQPNAPRPSNGLPTTPPLPPPPAPRLLPGPAAPASVPATPPTIPSAPVNGYRSIAALADEAARLNTQIGFNLGQPPLPPAVANRVFTPPLATASLAQQKQALVSFLSTMDPIWREQYGDQAITGPAAALFGATTRFPVRLPESSDLNYDLVLNAPDGTVRIGIPAA